MCIDMSKSENSFGGRAFVAAGRVLFRRHARCNKRAALRRLEIPPRIASVRTWRVFNCQARGVVELSPRGSLRGSWWYEQLRSKPAEIDISTSLRLL